jgi:hypothetical protein
MSRKKKTNEVESELRTLEIEASTSISEWQCLVPDHRGRSERSL